MEKDVNEIAKATLDKVVEKSEKQPEDDPERSEKDKKEN